MTTGDPGIPGEIVADLVRRVRDGLTDAGLEAVVAFDRSNMLAVTGVSHCSSDRMVCAAVLRDGSVHVACPAFERAAFARAESTVAIHPWEEDENPYAAFAAALRTAGVRSGRIGLDGRTWISAQEAFSQAFGGERVIAADSVFRQSRICKSDAELAILRAAHRRGERVFLAAMDLVRPGVAELRLHAELCKRMDTMGITVDPLVQSGPTAADPHQPAGDRALQDGDAVVIDSVITHCGYVNDLTRTYAVGAPDAEVRAAYRAVRDAQAAAIDAAGPGVECRELDRIARSVIARAGFDGCMLHRLGHGIGLEGHEPPYLNGANSERLRPGMCVTIEPGIYVRGRFGIRIEDDLIITPTGCEVIGGQLATDVSPALAV